jgi:hypothetical protein
MPIVCLDCLSFTGLACAFKFQPSKHTETSIWSIRKIKVNHWYLKTKKSLLHLGRHCVTYLDLLISTYSVSSTYHAAKFVSF